MLSHTNQIAQQFAGATPCPSCPGPPAVGQLAWHLRFEFVRAFVRHSSLHQKKPTRCTRTEWAKDNAVLQRCTTKKSVVWHFWLALRYGFSSCLRLIGGRCGNISAQNIPANIRAKVFAAHAGQFLDQWAIFGRDSALAITPKQDGLRRNPYFKCQPVRIPSGLNSYLNGCHAVILHM
jgi:hypothetical protein